MMNLQVCELEGSPVFSVGGYISEKLEGELSKLVPSICNATEIFAKNTAGTGGSDVNRPSMAVTVDVPLG